MEIKFLREKGLDKDEREKKKKKEQIRGGRREGAQLKLGAMLQPLLRKDFSSFG